LDFNGIRRNYANISRADLIGLFRYYLSDKSLFDACLELKIKEQFKAKSYFKISSI